MNIDTIISIKPEPDKKARRKGIPGRRDDDTWRRRQSRDVYVRYWDLAQHADGSDIDFSKQCTLDEVRDSSLIDNQTVPEIVLNYNDFSSELLAYYQSIDRDSWATAFKEIDDSLIVEYESTSATGTSGSYVPNKGFLLGPADLSANFLGVSSLRHFYNWNTISTDFKLTATDDYSSPAATFNLNRSCEVYLVPQIHLWQGGNIYRILPSTTQNIQILGLFLAPESREFTLNNATWDGYKSDFVAWLASIGGNHWLLAHVFSTTYHATWVDLVKNHPACQLFSASYTSADYPLLLEQSDLTPGSPSAFKDGSEQGVGGVSFTVRDPSFPQWQYGPWVGLRRWHQPAGLLMAVIHQGSDWFYLWRNVTSDVALYHSGTFIYSDPPFGTPTGMTWALFGGVGWGFDS